jgi:hypothetical protein
MEQIQSLQPQSNESAQLQFFADIFPAEMGRQIGIEGIPWGADSREALAADVYIAVELSHTNGPQIPRRARWI